MYKLLIVDDEEIEREGMAHFIPWEEQGIQLVGTAWNGVQGLEMMECLRPDIVLVDVKMPVMNGLEMIRQARQTFPDVVYVILSGYGEYEFTSQAMEEGVRHYLLKPCDEKRIREVLDKVKAELSERQAQASKDRDARVLLPHAREQIFCDLVLDRAQVGSTATCHFMERLGGESRPVLLATVRLTRGFDYLERFVIGNIMTDLLPTGTLLCTGGQEQDTFLLLDPAAGAGLEQAFARLQVEFRRFEKAPLQAAVSAPGALGGLPELYRQTAALLALGGGVCCGTAARRRETAHSLTTGPSRTPPTTSSFCWNCTPAWPKCSCAGTAPTGSKPCGPWPGNCWPPTRRCLS